MANRLTIFKRGNTFYVRGTIKVGEHKQPVYESTGLFDEQEANLYAAKLEVRITDELLHGRKLNVTFEHAMVSYGDSSGSPRYMKKVAEAFGAKRLSTISQSDLDAAARSAYPDASPETRNRQFYTPFIAVWNHAVTNGLVEYRRWRRPRAPKGTNVIRIKGERAGAKPIEYELASRFISAMSPAPAMLTTFLFYTGMRPIEALALTAADINIAGRWIIVRSSKTGEPRGVPMHEFLASWLPDLCNRGGVLFRAPDGNAYLPVGYGEKGGGLKTAINGARRRSGIAGISLYTARHTVSTQLVVNGVHPHIKDQILGHAADSMSRHYTHVPQKPLIAAINTLPVPDQMRTLNWVNSPKEWWSRLAAGTGKRNDLVRVGSNGAR